MSSKLFTTIISSRMRVAYSRRNLALLCHNKAVRDTFIIQSATTREDYEFVSQIINQQWCMGVNMITHVGPIIKPGYFIGYLNGQRIGCISACKYGEGNDGLLYYGSYTITKPFRGKGYGSQLTRKMFNLGKKYSIGFDSLLNMIPTYERLIGTCDKSLYREYILPCSSIVQSVLKAEETSSVKDVTQINCKPINSFDFLKLLTYDASVFGFLREAFLRAWITIPENIGLVATNKNGNIIGYAVMHPCINDEKEEQIIGPLFSDNDHVTRLLLYTLAKTAIDKKGSSMLRLTVPVESNPRVAKLIEMEMGCTTFLESMRMYTRGFPQHVCVKKIVAINSTLFG